MTAITAQSNRRTCHHWQQAITARSCPPLSRYRVAWGAASPCSFWPKQQSDHALDVDHQPAQQILDAVPGAAAIACSAAIVVADQLGQLAFDRRMLPPYLLVRWGAGLRARTCVLGRVVVDHHHPSGCLGQLLQTLRLQGAC